MTALEPQFSRADVEVLETSQGFAGYLRVDRFRLRHRLYEGGWSETIDRELLVRDRAVGVLLYDPGRDKVVMVRQFRVGAMTDGASPWLLELVAGMVGRDETPEAVAVRETAEEANCAIGNLLKIREYYNSPGVSDEQVILFCARVDAGSAGGVHGLAAEHEDIEVVALPADEAIAAVESGRINNAMTIIALQWLNMNKSKLSGL